MSLPPAHTEVHDHRPCRRCGYDLLGLPADGSCPECGAPVQSQGFDKRFADTLTDAPLPYLKRLTLAFWILAGSILVAVLARVLDAFGVFTLGVLSPVLADGAILLATASWLLGVWLATPTRPRTELTAPDPLLDSPGLRRAIRVTQSAAPLAALAAAAIPHTPPALAVALFFVTGALGIVAFLGASALCAYLSALADWAGDTGVADRLRASAWGIAVMGLISLGCVLLSPLAPSLLVVGSWTSLLLLLAVVLFVFAIFELGRLTAWAVANHITGVERDERIAARRKRASEELAARVTRLDDAVPYEVGAPPPPGPDAEEALPLAEPDPDDDIDGRLDALSPARPSPSKIHFPRQAFPPVGRHASIHDAPAAPRPAPTDAGEEHYTEHRVEPRRAPDHGAL